MGSVETMWQTYLGGWPGLAIGAGLVLVGCMVLAVARHLDGRRA